MTAPAGHSLAGVLPYSSFEGDDAETLILNRIVSLLHSLGVAAPKGAVVDLWGQIVATLEHEGVPVTCLLSGQIVVLEAPASDNSDDGGS